MKRTWKTAAFLALLAGTAGAWAGTLVIGTPEVSGNQVTVPVMLDGPQEGVAALDFRLNYDPTVFSPVGAAPGSSASAANKQVQSNVVKDGEMVVIAMGMNQNVFQPGEVARITLELTGQASGADTRLGITNPTLASAQGVGMPVSGSVKTFGIPLSGDTSNDGSDTGQDNDASSNPDNQSGSPDVTQPSKDSQDDMQVAQRETGADESASTPAVGVPVSSESGSSSRSQSAPSGASVPGGATADPQDVGATDGGKSLKQLAAATRTARNLRESIPTPSARADGSASGESSPAVPMPGSPTATADKPVAGASTEPEAVDGDSSEAATGSQDLTMAKVEASGEARSPRGMAEQAGGSASAEDATAAQPSVSVKLILLGVVVAVLVAVFLVRRRLFS